MKYAIRYFENNLRLFWPGPGLFQQKAHIFIASDNVQKSFKVA